MSSSSSSSSTEPAGCTVTKAEPAPAAETSTSTTTEKITLKSCDKELFEVEKEVAMEFVTLKTYFEEDGSNDAVVPLPNVTAGALSQVIAFCEKQVDFRRESTGAKEEEKKKYEADFVEDMKNEEIKELMLAANYLDVGCLLDVLCKAVADSIKNKSVEHVRGLFGIENDFTPEEEAAVRQENLWAFDGVDED